MPTSDHRGCSTPVRATEPSVDWRHRAACREADGDLFFPLPGETARPALTYCERCPVRAECLADAIAKGEGGVRGGMTESARDQLVRTRRRAAAS